MTRAAKLFLSVAIGAIIMLAGHAAASAQCPPGWNQKTVGVTFGGCLLEVTYCLSPTPPFPQQLYIMKVRNMLPFPCGNGSLLDMLNTAEKAVIAVEIGGGGEDPEHTKCTQPVTPTQYTVSRALCYDPRPDGSFVACNGGMCTKTYSVFCDLGTGQLIYTVVAGPTMSGICPPPPVGWTCSSNVPCN